MPTGAELQTAHGLRRSAGCYMPIHAHFFVGRQNVARKVGQTGLVFAAWSGVISRSVQARLQVSECSSDVNKDWTHKDKDKDQTYKDKDKDQTLKDQDKDKD